MARPILLLTLCVAAALPAPVSAQVVIRRDRNDDYQTSIDTTFAFDKRGVVNMTLRAGEIIVTSWNRDQVRVRARSERDVIRMDATSTRVSLDIQRGRGGDTRFEVTVPIGVSVSARATSGDISITGTKGSVEANTQSGDLRVEDAADRIDIGTLSGDITARNIAGNIEVRAISGDLTLTDAKGDVEAGSVSGEIELRGVQAKYVRAKSTSGDITFDGSIDPNGRYELGSHSGSVTINLPPNVGALFTVSTYNGAIDSDFPITLKPGEHGMGSSKRFTFEIGKGDARISAESFSGDITIRSKSGRRPGGDQ